MPLRNTHERSPSIKIVSPICLWMSGRWNSSLNSEPFFLKSSVHINCMVAHLPGAEAWIPHNQYNGCWCHKFIVTEAISGNGTSFLRINMSLYSTRKDFNIWHRGGRIKMQRNILSKIFIFQNNSAQKDLNLQLSWSNTPWRRHQMETFSTLLALCEGNMPVTGGFPSQNPATRSFDVFFFYLRLYKRLRK